MKARGWMGVLLTLFGVVAGRGAPAEPPAEPPVEGWIDQLGAEDFQERVDAQRALRELAETMPRRMIVELAEALPRAKDLEVRIRMRELLTEWAREWMFYQPGGFLGINFRWIRTAEDGAAVEILQAMEGGAAQEAGLRTGDRLVEIAGRAVADLDGQEGFMSLIADIPPGRVVPMVVERNGERFAVEVLLGARPVDTRNVVRVVEEEEAKIRAWLAGLQGREGWREEEEPVGHYRLPTDAPR